MLAFDHHVFVKLNAALSTAPAPFVFALITWLGHGVVLAAIIIPLLAWRDRYVFRTHVPAMIVSVVSSGLIVMCIKSLVSRPRPVAWAAANGVQIHTHGATPADGSFPSGHTQTAFGVAVYLSLLYPKATPVWIGVAVAVGMSRICLGVHFPADVLVGAAIGTTVALVTFTIQSRRLKALK